MVENIESSCGGLGICGKCKIKVLHGKVSEVTETENRILGEEEIKKGYRLACMTRGYGEIVIEVPEVKPRILESKKIFSSKKAENYGIVVDIGTTTVVVAIIDLKTGNKIAELTELNRQMKYGYDVISRVSTSLRELNKAIISQFNDMVIKLTSSLNIGLEKIKKCICVGNPAMIHSFFGIPVDSLGKAPFIPHTKSEILVSGKAIGLATSCKVYSPPIVSGFFGGDALSFILSQKIYEKRNVLGIDIGTNGEIVLSTEDKIFATSTAAGPAFEGVSLSCGMLAREGAIEKVRYSNGFRVYTIGDCKPSGICGSGYIDAIASMLKAGLIDGSGKIVEGERVNITDEIYITREDIFKIQIAKAAIFTGIDILLDRGKIDKEDIEAVLIAGSFGRYINPVSAVIIGLLPEVNPEIVKTVGNAALEGAVALRFKKNRYKIQKIASDIEYVNLYREKTFEDKLVDATFLPHLDKKRFANIERYMNMLK